MNNPLISVVTVVYNGAATLEQTMLSVINQTHRNIEYIIIDGGSTDGTVDIIKKYEKHLAYWVSEPDKGIYDAMNKGIDKATGEWINFMNSGDTFYSNIVIADLIGYINSNIAILYGNICFNKKAVHVFPEKITSLYFLIGRMICHQSIFARRDLFEIKSFDIQYKTVADKEWLISMVKKKIRTKHVPVTVCNYDISGSSSDVSEYLNASMTVIKKHHQKKVSVSVAAALFQSAFRHQRAFYISFVVLQIFLP
jgi:glycosyltransferase involved in cell wall biosynthesis